MIARGLQVGGRTWHAASFTAPWDFGIANARRQQAVVLAAGLLITALGALVVWSVARTREAALRLAGEMTAELSATQARFERMVGGTSDGVWEIDLASGAAYCSPRCRALLGWNAGSGVMTLPWAVKRIDLSDRRRVLGRIQASACAPAANSTSSCASIPAPAAAPALVSPARPRLGGGGRRTLHVRRAGRHPGAGGEAQEREDRLLRVIESSPDIALTFNPQGRITYLSAAARRAFGAIGGGGEKRGGVGDFVQGELGPHRRAPGPRRGRQQRRRRHDVAGAGTELALADGGTLPVSQVVIGHGHDSGSGTVLYYSMVMRDIRIRRRIEAALKQAQARYDRALAGANDGIWEFEPRTGTLFCSERMEDLLGVARGWWPAHPSRLFARLIHPDDH